MHFYLLYRFNNTQQSDFKTDFKFLTIYSKFYIAAHFNLVHSLVTSYRSGSNGYLSLGKRANVHGEQTKPSPCGWLLPPIVTFRRAEEWSRIRPLCWHREICLLLLCSWEHAIMNPEKKCCNYLCGFSEIRSFEKGIGDIWTPWLLLVFSFNF